MSGAVVRAVLMVLLVVMPSMALPGITDDTMQIVTLVAIFTAALVIFEYGSVYPGIVEFRGAPPYNRLRFVALFVTVFALTMVARHHATPNDTSRILFTVGTVMADLLDFPYSPVRLAVLMLPDATHPEVVERFRVSAATSYLISLISLMAFGYFVRFRRWPINARSFNVWINLPTFDPTSGDDVVARMNRDARLNIALGIVMPFLVPAVLKSGASVFGAIHVDNPLTMVWVAAGWAFLPASLFMRGVALARIARLIEAKRRSVPRSESSLQTA